MTIITNNLIGETDAKVWASTWLEVISEIPSIPSDEGTMLAWFATAIMAGYDHGRHMEQKRNSVEKMREIIYQAVGAATVPFMEDHPNYVFPSERVQAAVEQICTEFGIPKVEGY